MAQVKTDLRKKTAEEYIVIFDEIIKALTGNANFPAPNPSLSELTAHRSKLQSKLDAVKAKENEWKVAIAARDTSQGEAVQAFNLLASHIQNVSKGDEAMILSSGFQVRATPGSPQPVGAPSDLRATSGDLEGEIDLMWDAEPGASIYVIECRESETTPWSAVKSVTQSRYTVTGLTPGKRYTFRVRAIGSLGEGPWSNLVEKRAA